MTLDSVRKNIAAYLVGSIISMLVGLIGDVHRQIVNGGMFDYWLMFDAAIVVVPSILTNMLINMKFPSVGSERVADKVQDVKDSLRVELPEAEGRG